MWKGEERGERERKINAGDNWDMGMSRKYGKLSLINRKKRENLEQLLFLKN